MQTKRAHKTRSHTFEVVEVTVDLPLSDDSLWATAVSEVTSLFGPICKIISASRPVPHLVEYSDLRQESYLVAFTLLKKLNKQRRLDLFRAKLFSYIKWAILAQYPSHRIEKDINVDELTNWRGVDAIDFLPGFIWPKEIPDGLIEKALGFMTQTQRDIWRDHLDPSASDLNNNYSGRGRWAYHKALNRGIDRVQSVAKGTL